MRQREMVGYSAVRVVKLQETWIGVGYLLLQLGVVVYIIVHLYLTDSWLLAETPGTTAEFFVNP